MKLIRLHFALAPAIQITVNVDNIAWMQSQSSPIKASGYTRIFFDADNTKKLTVLESLQEIEELL